MLRLVVTLARTAVGGADGASVSLRRHGILATEAATDQAVSDRGASQYASGEGPCVDVSVGGRWFHAQSLETEPRWVAFTPRSRMLGIRAVLSSPPFDRAGPCGVLNFYSRHAVASTPEDQKLASTVAAHVSSVLSGAAVAARDARFWARFPQALGVHEAICRAGRVLMERHRVGRGDAYSLLRRSLLWAGTPLRVPAANVVDAVQRLLPREEVGHGSAP
jgi:GAF domain